MHTCLKLGFSTTARRVAQPDALRIVEYVFEITSFYAPAFAPGMHITPQSLRGGIRVGADSRDATLPVAAIARSEIACSDLATDDAPSGAARGA
jgi:hypothetical protein